MSKEVNNRIFIFLSGFWLIALVFLFWVFGNQVVLLQGFSFLGWFFHFYGLILAFALIAGWYVVRKILKNENIPLELLETVGFWVIIFGLAGARTYHVLTDFHIYRADFWLVLKIWNGGLSIYGALFGGFLALLFLRYLNEDFKKINFWQVLDIASIGVLVGQIIGRFGNLFNYEAFGKPTELPWKMFVPTEFRPLGFESSGYFHPTFLYEALGNTFILFILLKFGKKFSQGSLFFGYVILYNALRLFTESLRLDAKIIDGIYFNWRISFGLIFLGLLGLVVFKKYGKRA